jgi:prepilin-type N-terminal cleavage/methylation domain-containing protein
MPKLAPARRRSRHARRAGLTLLELVMVVSILAILTALVVPGMTDQSEETRKTVARATMQEVRDIIANRYLENMGSLPQPMLTGSVLDTTRITTTTQVTGTSAVGLPQLQFLFVNPRQFDSSAGLTPDRRYMAINDFDQTARIGWNGPYMMAKSTTYPNPEAVRFATDPNDTRTWAQFGFTTTFGQTGDFTIMDPWGSPYVIIVRSLPHGGSTAYTAYVVSAGFNRTLETTAVGSATTGDDLLLPIKTWK